MLVATDTSAMPIGVRLAVHARAAVRQNGHESDGGGGTEVPEPKPEEKFAGKFDSSFAKAQTSMGALYDAGGALIGVVQMKAGKKGKNGTAKMSASVMLMNGKKLSAKAITMDVSGGVATLVFKAPIGSMKLTLMKNGAFKIEGAGGSHVVDVDVGENLPNGDRTFRVDVGTSSPKFDSGFKLLKEAFRETVVLKVTGGKKLDAGKAAVLKYTKNKTGGMYELQGLDDPARLNVMGLKLSYKPKTGAFKGSFKLYATNEAAILAGKSPKLKKYTVNVTGFFIAADGGPKRGIGTASVKNLSTGQWAVVIE